MAPEKIAILVDSGSDVPQEYREKYHMYVAPLTVIYPDGEYRDGIDIQPEDLQDASYDMLLDVRGKSEYADGSIPGAEHISGGVALWHQDELPDNGTIVTFCQSGARNTVVSNALRRAGFHIVELEGSYAAWQNQAN